MKFWKIKSEVEQLESEYENACEFNRNHMVKTQVDVVKRLCAIDSQDSIALIGKLMAEGNNHEYMNFALPDLLELHWEKTDLKDLVGETFVYGMWCGQTAEIKSGCIHKLIKALYIDAYSDFLEYQSFLRFNQSERPKDWQALLELVSYGSKIFAQAHVC